MSQRSVEIVVAIVFLFIGAVAMYDSWQIGAGWSDGPQSGYFPFYISLIMSAASVMNLVHAVAGGPREAFVDWDSFKRVLTVLIPATIFVMAIPYLGIYVAGAIFIALFMFFVGKYPIWKGALIGGGVMIVLFFVFQRWFLIKLPTGPVEQMLNLG